MLLNSTFDRNNQEGYGIYATLIGIKTDRSTEKHAATFNSLHGIADSLGFISPDEEFPVQPDQIPLSGWTITLKGPRGGHADFLLAVTSPAGMSPIPIQQTIEAPLFAVVVMDSCFGVKREDRRDFAEYKTIDDIGTEFRDFLENLKNKE